MYPAYHALFFVFTGDGQKISLLVNGYAGKRSSEKRQLNLGNIHPGQGGHVFPYRFMYIFRRKRRGVSRNLSLITEDTFIVASLMRNKNRDYRVTFHIGSPGSSMTEPMSVRRYSLNQTISLPLSAMKSFIRAKSLCLVMSPLKIMVLPTFPEAPPINP